MRQVLLCSLMWGCTFLLADDSTHPNFTGTWQIDAAKCEVHSKAPVTAWDIRQTEDSISINERREGKTESLTCELSGKSCKTKVEGESAEVTFYYNGDMLVETDLLGHGKDHVVKKRLKLARDGKMLEVDVMYINPVAPSEKWVFEKQ